MRRDDNSIGIPRTNRDKIGLGQEHRPCRRKSDRADAQAEATPQEQMTVPVVCSGTHAFQQRVQMLSKIC